MLVDGDVGDELGALLAVDDDGMLKLKWIISCSTTHWNNLRRVPKNKESYCQEWKSHAGL